MKKNIYNKLNKDKQKENKVNSAKVIFKINSMLKLTSFLLFLRRMTARLNNNKQKKPRLNNLFKT